MGSKRRKSCSERMALPERPMDRLVELVRVLRSERGCPWDRKQTAQSLKPLLLEESYEVLEAIDSGDPDKVKEELGDLLMHIVLYAQLGREQGSFDFDEVVRGLAEKLLRRHPHVFGEKRLSSAEEVLGQWEELKREERGGEPPSSAIEGVPRHTPALRRAQVVQAKASRVGFDWSEAAEVLAKVQEELSEVKEAFRGGIGGELFHEIGDLLFAVVNLARFLGMSAEEALQKTVERFVRRFREIEERVHRSGRQLTDCTLEELDRIWEEVKLGEELE